MEMFLMRESSKNFSFEDRTISVVSAGSLLCCGKIRAGFDDPETTDDGGTTLYCRDCGKEAICNGKIKAHALWHEPECVCGDDWEECGNHLIFIRYFVEIFVICPRP
ncbi:hypothetical protein [Ethanoligenens harbinense]|uniref:hypothetical protein n=1 Tax=Ethanoligenens harbinense TaxID=253239 RepID=UPI0010C13A74|nr:hypothetical protein [Ethanoligenens harbinense]